MIEDSARPNPGIKYDEYLGKLCMRIMCMFNNVCHAGINVTVSE